MSIRRTFFAAMFFVMVIPALAAAAAPEPVPPLKTVLPEAPVIVSGTSTAQTFAPTAFPRVDIFSATTSYDAATRAIAVRATVSNSYPDTVRFQMALAFAPAPKKEGDPAAHQYTLPIGEPLLLASGESREFTHTLRAPPFLKGKYMLFLDGGRLPAGRIETVVYAGTHELAGDAPAASLSSCTIAGKKTDGILTLSPGLAKVSCSAKYLDKGTRTLLFSAALRNSPLASATSTGERYVNVSEKAASVEMTMTVPEAAGVYLAELAILDEARTPLALPVSFPVHVKGPAVRIIDFAKDKPSYANGDTALVIVESRLRDIPGATISVELLDRTRSCGTPEAKAYSPMLQFSLPVTRDCAYPTAFIKVMDKDGGVVHEERFAPFMTPAEEKALAKEKHKNTVAFFGSILLLLAVALYVAVTRTIITKAPLAFLLLAISAGFALAPYAAFAINGTWTRSAEYVDGGGPGLFPMCLGASSWPDGTARGSIAFDNPSYAPNAAMTITVSLIPDATDPPADSSFAYDIPNTAPALGGTLSSIGAAVVSQPFPVDAPAVSGTYPANGRVALTPPVVPTPGPNCDAISYTDSYSDTGGGVWGPWGVNPGRSLTNAYTVTTTISGVCAATHNNCIFGTAINIFEDASYWYWTCQGSGAGAFDQACSEAKRTALGCGDGVTEYWMGGMNCIAAEPTFQSCPVGTRVYRDNFLTTKNCLPSNSYTYTDYQHSCVADASCSSLCAPTGSLYQWNGLNWDDFGGPLWTAPIPNPGPADFYPKSHGNGIWQGTVVNQGSQTFGVGSFLWCDPSYVPPSSCTWSAYGGAGDDEIRNCNFVAPGNTACNQSGCSEFITNVCPAGAVVGGNSSGYANGYTCYRSGTAWAAADICWADALVSNCGGNTPPVMTQFTGEQNPVQGTNYTYALNATDDAGQVRYEIDWHGNGMDAGDTYYPGSSTFVAAATVRNVNRIWPTPGTYTARARACDQGGLCSSWMDLTPVTVSALPAPTVTLYPVFGMAEPSPLERFARLFGILKEAFAGGTQTYVYGVDTPQLTWATTGNPDFCEMTSTWGGYNGGIPKPVNPAGGAENVPGLPVNLAGWNFTIRCWHTFTLLEDIDLATLIVRMPQCNDGLDNDGDGPQDYLGGAGDPSCSSDLDDDEAGPAQCADSIDNDGSGATDMADPSCSGPSDNDETNPVVPIPTTVPPGPPPAARLDDPSAYSCGSANVNINPYKSCAAGPTLHNIGEPGSSYTVVGVVSSNPTEFWCTNCGAIPPITPGVPFALNIAFRPYAEGVRSSTITITLSTGEVFNVVVTGTGVMPFAPASIDFGRIIAGVMPNGSTTEKTPPVLRMLNNGVDPIPAGVFSIPTDATNPANGTARVFTCWNGAAWATSCPYGQVEPGQYLEMRIRFAPVRPERFTTRPSLSSYDGEDITLDGWGATGQIRFQER